MILTGIRTLFIATSGITSLVGTSGVYVSAVPQGIKVPQSPIILLTEMGSDPHARLDGTAGLLRKTTIDIDCKAATAEAASNIADQVETRFNEFTGAAGNETIRAVILQDRTTSFEPPQDKSDQGKHVVTLDYMVQWVK